jgi:DNA-binding transcriptional LysR family regulator
MISGHVFNTNMDYYRVFYYVVKFKSITLAADRLSLTQPSVSKTIQRLEEDLRCKLFTRTKNGVTLTTEGEALWARVESACELIIAAERELEAIQTLESGTMNIASMEMGFSTYILPALRLFLKAYPNIKVRFRSAMHYQILEMLKAGLIDLAVLSPPDELDDAFESRTIDVFQESLIVGPRYSFLTEREQTLEELSQYPFISMPEGSPGKAYMKECFRKFGLIYEPDIEVTSMEFVIQAAAADFGIGTVPLPVVKSRIENGTLFRLRLKDKLPERRALAITNRSIAASRATQVFMEEFLLKQSNADKP